MLDFKMLVQVLKGWKKDPYAPMPGILQYIVHSAIQLYCCSPVKLLKIRRYVSLIFSIIYFSFVLSAAFFTCVVKLLYNLLYFQVVVQASCKMSPSERSHWRGPSPPNPSELQLDTLEEAVSRTIHAFDSTQLYLEDISPPIASGPASAVEPTTDKQLLEKQIQKLCLPFLRVAALLRHHMYDEPLPEIDSPESEFVRLVYYLELVNEGMSLSR